MFKLRRMHGYRCVPCSHLFYTHVVMSKIRGGSSRGNDLRGCSAHRATFQKDQRRVKERSRDKRACDFNAPSKFGGVFQRVICSTFLFRKKL